MKRGLVLDKVVLLGRTLEEYQRFFALDLGRLKGASVLDVASGVSSFCAEATQLGVNVTAFDPIYNQPPDVLREQCASDLERVASAIGNHPTYRWDFYKTPANQRSMRARAFRTFLADYASAAPGRYVHGFLPKLPFADGQFDLTLVSYFLFVYQDLFDFAFHREALSELMRVTCGELRIYPTVSFEATRSVHLDRLFTDDTLQHLKFEEVQTDFEFLLNSNSYLRVTRKAA